MGNTSTFLNKLQFLHCVKQQALVVKYFLGNDSLPNMDEQILTLHTCLNSEVNEPK